MKNRRNLYHIILFTLTILFSVGSFAQVHLQKDLLRYLPLNGNANDYSTYNENGIAYRVDTTKRFNLENECFHVASTDSSNVTIPSIGDWGSELSISFWFKPDSLSESNNFSEVVYSYNSASTGYANFGVRINHADSLLNWLVWGQNVNHVACNSQNKVLIGEWNHAIVTLNVETNTQTIVLNGEANSNVGEIIPRYLNADIGFGGLPENSRSSSQGFNGFIDDIRIYSRLLSKLEEEMLASTVFVGIEGDYPLNGTANDISAHQAHGTAENADYDERYGVPEQTMRVNKSGNVTVPSLGDWSVQGNGFTLSLWIKPDSLNSDNTATTVVGSRSADTGEYVNFYCTLMHDDSTLIYKIGSFEGASTVVSTNKVTIGNWNHIVLYHDVENDSVGLILNGVKNSLEWTNTPKFKNTSIGFGNWNNVYNNNSGLSGLVDEVKVYRRQLTSDEVAMLGDRKYFNIGLNYKQLAYYPFNGNYRDYTGNNIDAVAHSTIIGSNKCDEQSRSVEFDSTALSFVELPEDVNPDSLPVAISLWLNTPDVITRQFIYRTDQWDSKVLYGGVQLSLNAGVLSASYGNARGTGPASRNTYFSDSAIISANQWHHIVVNYLGKNNIKLYVDTFKDTSNTYSGSAVYMANSSAKGMLGMGYNNAAPFMGKLDEVRVYTRELFEYEIHKLYNSGCNTPPVADNKTFDIEENTPNGIVVGDLEISDADFDDISILIKEGDSSNAFAISENSLIVNDSSFLDYESTSTFILVLEVTDGVDTLYPTLTINLIDRDEATNTAPEILSQSFNVDENVSSGIALGSVLATDAEDDVLIFFLEDANASAEFTINASSGELSANTSFDFESVSTYTISIGVSDGLDTSYAVITITVNDVFENTPPVLESQEYSIYENSEVYASIATVLASDVDTQELEYLILSGNDPEVIALNISTGEVTIADSSAFDFETNNSFIFEIGVFDGFDTTKAQLTILVNDVLENNAPILSDQSFSVDENSPNGTIIGTVTASDADSDELTFFATHSFCKVDSSSGSISITEESIFDYETMSSFIIEVAVTDGVDTVYANITISIVDVDEPITTSTENSIYEIKFYPNPVNEFIFFTTTIESAEIFSVNGSLIMKKEQVSSFDVSELPRGSYILIYRVDGYSKTEVLNK